ncbi:hypothetical protein Acr_09g0006430 [Actinidia rufa]|uniref:VQ domain-containing protein n=1 Tax=Actinidia rufa TaxID=165716 RepID=A0A7J0F8E3_9ERIC|nr:hypothetical protein Acr_09g0006430 [Actinidia rufa]
MQPPESSGDGSSTPTRKQLQGPRPPQLKVRRESHAIRKPPKAPPPPPPPPPQPVIIYSVSPKVIHTTVSDFMPLVQRLTGSSSAGDVSPAARLASIERTSPTDREKHREILISNDDDAIMGGMVQVEGVRQIPGILSPAPATLPPISPGFFAPGAGSDPYSLSLLQDQYLISPSFHDNMFMPSPSSTLFSAPIVSPSPSSLDLFNPFFDY